VACAAAGGWPVVDAADDPAGGFRHAAAVAAVNVRTRTVEIDRVKTIPLKRRVGAKSDCNP
jgi:hypothetical protein